MYTCEYFNITELVSPVVYNRFGSFAWNFFDERMLEDLDLLRELWGKPLIINNWKNGGQYKESGLRCNVDSIVKAKTTPYLSAHTLGRGFDIKPQNLKDVPLLHECVIDNYKKFKVLSRIENLEATPTWVHVDSLIPRGKEITIF